MVLAGTVPGDSVDYDLTIKKDGKTLQFVDKCKDDQCSKRTKKGTLLITNALQQKVFTLAFADEGGFQTGFFFAVPGSIKMTKTQHGYRATYQGVYEGVDPSSKNKDYFKQPIKFTCKQKYDI